MFCFGHPPPLTLLQELAHLYHYYLHGEQGNRAAGGSKAVREGRLPNGEPFPDIVLQYQVGGCWGHACDREPCWQLAGPGLLLSSHSDMLHMLHMLLVPPAPLPLSHSEQVDSRTVWRQRLSEVEDDMETKLLRAQQAELPFTLQVPDKASL